jgi:hypothetical protein
MPSADRLPPDLAQLAFRNAFELSDRRWEYDIGELVKLLQSFPDRHVASLRTKLAAKRSVALRAVLSTVVVAVGGATIITQCQRNLIGPVLAEPTSGTAVAPSLAVVPTSITTGVPPANSSTAIASSTELGTPAAQLSISHTAWIVASQQLDPVWNQARWPTAIAITQAYQTSYPGAGPTELAEAREKEYAARLNYAGTLQRNGDTAAAVTQLERAQAISDGDLSANATLSALTPTPTPTATSAPATPTPYTFLITSGD